MKIVEEITDVNGDPQGTLGTVPLAKRQATTSLVVKDQETVVIGGLVRNRVAHGQTKIPILGDIPVLGALFRSSSDQVEKSNLVLVLTPHIIRDQGDLRTIFERKMQERQEFLDHYFVFSDHEDYMPPKDYSRTSGLVEEIRQGFASIKERQDLENSARPPPLLTHEPGVPIELPAGTHSSLTTTGAGTTPAGGAPVPAGGTPPPATPATPPPAIPPSNINVNPPVRNLERIER